MSQYVTPGPRIVTIEDTRASIVYRTTACSYRMSEYLKGLAQSAGMKAVAVPADDPERVAAWLLSERKRP